MKPYIVALGFEVRLSGIFFTQVGLAVRGFRVPLGVWGSGFRV